MIGCTGSKFQVKHATWPSCTRDRFAPEVSAVLELGPILGLAATRAGAQGTGRNWEFGAARAPANPCRMTGKPLCQASGASGSPRQAWFAIAPRAHPHRTLADGGHACDVGRLLT
jgi:hypothetical protein